MYRRLEVLQDQAEPQDFEDVKRALETELGRSLEELFVAFDPKAKAAASLAQVHSLWPGIYTCKVQSLN